MNARGADSSDRAIVKVIVHSTTSKPLTPSTEPPRIFRIAENRSADPNASIGQLTVSRPGCRYSFLRNTAEYHIRLDPLDGRVYVSTEFSVDRDTWFHLLVRATCQEDGYADISGRLLVEDVSFPELRVDDVDVRLHARLISPGVIVHRFHARLNAENAVLAYTITEYPFTRHFEVRGDALVLKVNAAALPVTSNGYVVVGDQAGNRDSARIRLRLVDGETTPPLTPPSFVTPTLLISVNESELLLADYIVYAFPVPPAGYAYKLATPSSSDRVFRLLGDGRLLIAGQRLDRETRDSYELRVSLSGAGGGAECRALVRVHDINDHAPSVSPDPAPFSVDRDARSGQWLGRVMASDADAGSNAVLRYAIATDNRFSVDPKSGDFYIRQTLLLPDPSPYSSSSSPTRSSSISDILEVLVDIEDGGIPKPRSTTYAVRVRRGAPDTLAVFVSGEHVQLYVSEGAKVGFNFSTLLVWPLNNGQYHFEIMYSLSTDSNTSSTSSTSNSDMPFVLDVRNGSLSVAQALDREVLSNFRFVVALTSAVSRRRLAEILVIVDITDINDNVPRWLPRATGNTGEHTMYRINAGASMGETLFTLRADDADTGVNARLTYDVSPASSYFVVNPHTGAVSLRVPLQTYVTYVDIVGGATDSGTPALRATRRIRVTVSADPANYAPSFSADTPTRISTLETRHVGSVLTTMHAFVNRVEDSLAGVEYSLLWAWPSTPRGSPTFSIDTDTGKLRLEAQLDAETVREYRLAIQACSDRTSSSGSQKQSSVHVLTIVVLDVDDEPLVFYGASTVYANPPNTPLDYAIDWRDADVTAYKDFPTAYRVDSDFMDGRLFTLYRGLQLRFSDHQNLPQHKVYRVRLWAGSASHVMSVVVGDKDAGIRITSTVYYDLLEMSGADFTLATVRGSIAANNSTTMAYFLVDSIPYFAINRTSGVLSTSGVPIDRDALRDDILELTVMVVRMDNMKSNSAKVNKLTSYLLGDG